MIQSAPPPSDVPLAALHAEFERRARAVLPAYVSSYYAVGAGAGHGTREGIEAWDALRFRPHVLTGTAGTDSPEALATTALGTPLRTPVMVAPMAELNASHPEGEAAIARAVAAAGSLLTVSTHTAIPFADIGAAGAPWWFQVYVMRDRTLTERLVSRAVEAGARALVLTADMVALLPRDVNPRNWPERATRSRLGNLSTAELDAAGPGGVAMEAALTPALIGWLHEISGLPVLVKGVLRADDAQRCVNAGAAGLVVSTHGGRRMGAALPSAHALPEVVAAVDGRAEVYVDSGVRTGEHVAAALALGARAVFVGRPFAWSLAAAGEAGPAALLERYATELRLVLTQLGIDAVNALTPASIAAR